MELWYSINVLQYCNVLSLMQGHISRKIERRGKYILNEFNLEPQSWIAWCIYLEDFDWN